MENFITDLHWLPKHYPFSSLKGRLICNRIAVGLRNKKLSRKVQLNLEKATNQAKQSEEVKKQQQCKTTEQNIFAINFKTRGKMQPHSLAYQQRFRSGIAETSAHVVIEMLIPGISVQQENQPAIKVTRRDIGPKFVVTQ